MINKVGRDIPDALLTNGREVYQGKNYMDGKYIQKASPRTRRCEKPVDTKVVDSLVEALKQCGAKDGMTFSFHHHLRDGDYVVNQVMAAAIEKLGLKDLTIAATSLGSAHDPIADYIEEGKVIGIQTSGIRGRMGEVVLSFHLHNRHLIAVIRLAFQYYPAVPRRLMLHLPDCAGFPICRYRYGIKVCRYNFA